MSFGERLKAARQFMGLSQKELAEVMNVTPQNLNQYEKNKRKPSKDMMIKLSGPLDCSYAYTRTGEPYFYKFVSPNHDPQYSANEEFNQFQFEDAEEESRPETIAAHFDGDEYTPEELEEIRKFAEFVKSKRPAAESSAPSDQDE